MTEGRQGGCVCGAVRYELASEPFDCGWCHCGTCRRISGSPAMVFATVPAGDLAWIRGGDKVRSFRSSSFAWRSYCADCGTPFLMKVDHQPGTVDFTVGTLDDPGAVAPEYHIFWSERVPWFEPKDDLPRHEKFRPDTRGLEGTEPPK